MIAVEKDHPDVNIIQLLLINSDHGYEDDDDDDRMTMTMMMMTLMISMTIE